jgi:alpha-L-arabinofuranosidase
VPVEIHWDGLSKFTSITGQVLSGDGAGAAAYNTFDNPHQVEPKPLTDITVGTNSFTSLLPACSVAAFTLKA